jgi:hypothetical protein
MLSKSLVALSALVPAALGAVYTVTVGIVEIDGQPGRGFDPSSIRPAAGDTIHFTFSLPEYVKNPPSVQHSATQSTFDTPCTPMSGGFDTGIQTTGSANTNTGNTFELQVNNTDPLWFFSSASGDCGSGMVLSVNPPLTGDQTAAAFVDRAKAQGSPPDSSSGAPASSSGAPPSSSTPASSGAPVSSGAPSSGSAGSQTRSATSTAPSASESGNNNAGVKVGAPAAGLVALAAAVFAGVF